MIEAVSKTRKPSFADGILVAVGIGGRGWLRLGDSN
jgi:hypothetical protein